MTVKGLFVHVVMGTPSSIKSDGIISWNVSTPSSADRSYRMETEFQFCHISGKWIYNLQTSNLKTMPLSMKFNNFMISFLYRSLNPLIMKTYRLQVVSNLFGWSSSPSSWYLPCLLSNIFQINFGDPRSGLLDPSPSVKSIQSIWTKIIYQ